MPRYFFNVRDKSEFVRDEEGISLANDECAREEAVLGARSLLKERIDRNELIDGQSFEVTNLAGELVFSYPFRDSIKLS